MVTSPSVELAPDSATDLDVTARLGRWWTPAFPAVDLLGAAAGMFQALPRWDGSEGPRRRIVIGPGVVAVESHDLARLERSAERQGERDRRRIDLLAADIASGEATSPPRGAVMGWSAKSRARMVRRMAELDYSPLLADASRPPAMVTLTLPGDWLTVAPTAAAFWKLVRKFLDRYESAWGARIVGVWKKEYQARGAVHLHILMVPPQGLDAVREMAFKDWLSVTWAEVVNHPDPQEFFNHLAAGTGIDFADGLRARDPMRLAVYFSKHGTFGAKAYQDWPPAEWVADGSTGRVWGVWGLPRAVAQVEVSHDDALAVARTLRRWTRAQRWRLRDGRTVRRRSGMRGHLGFVVVRDGPAIAAEIARFLDLRRAWEGGDGDGSRILAATAVLPA